MKHPAAYCARNLRQVMCLLWSLCSDFLAQNGDMKVSTAARCVVNIKPDPSMNAYSSADYYNVIIYYLSLCVVAPSRVSPNILWGEWPTFIARSTVGE